MNKILNEKAIKIGETPIMNESNIFPQIFEAHMTPKDKWAKVVVMTGEIDFKWDDDECIYVINQSSPFIIEPERLHKLILKGRVELKIEFYKIPNETATNYSKDAKRPGENFL